MSDMHDFGDPAASLAPFAADLESETADRLIDAALACYARQGFAKTTAEDVAREAGLSRATLYRTFAGSEGLRLAVLRREALRFITALEARIAEATTLEDIVVAVFVDAEAAWRGHAVLSLMMQTEPQLLLPALVGRASPVLQVVTDLLLPYVQAHADDHPLAGSEPRRFAEWVVRTGFSYVMLPSDTVQFGDETAVRRFVKDQFFPQRHEPRESEREQETP